jgi:hypothetical protein
MLLETLDIKKDDIVIYSQNISDAENNFKIIFKDDPEKKIRKIGFSDVCRFVNEFSPKNLIVYRLLTNLTHFSLNTSKYGFRIFVNEEPELIYFDPIFAVKELEEYPGIIDTDLRFRIQQVGLTTLNRKDNSTNYAEIYSIDLRAYEAKFQKDKVFADAIFALNKAYNTTKKVAVISDNSKLKPEVKGSGNIKKELKNQENPAMPGVQKKAEEIKQVPVRTFREALKKEVKKELPVKNGKQEIKNDVKIPAIITIKEEITGIPVKENELSGNEQTPPVIIEEINDLRFIKHDISEDKDFDYKQILKMNFRENKESYDTRKELPHIIKHEDQQNSFRDFLKAKLEPVEIIKEGESETQITNIFKSPEPLKKIVEEREKEKIVLRLNKK